jgi:hypothetical protein
MIWIPRAINLLATLREHGGRRVDEGGVVGSRLVAATRPCLPGTRNGSCTNVMGLAGSTSAPLMLTIRLFNGENSLRAYYL